MEKTKSQKQKEKPLKSILNVESTQNKLGKAVMLNISFIIFFLLALPFISLVVVDVRKKFRQIVTKLCVIFHILWCLFRWWKKISGEKIVWHLMDGKFVWIVYELLRCWGGKLMNWGSFWTLRLFVDIFGNVLL